MISLRRSIDAKCKQCVYDPLCGGGTWREQVAQCTVLACPLWPIRTGPKSGPYKDYPTDPANCPDEWLKHPIGWLNRGSNA
jgi:hypothetical protein